MALPPYVVAMLERCAALRAKLDAERAWASLGPPRDADALERQGSTKRALQTSEPIAANLRKNYRDVRGHDHAEPQYVTLENCYVVRRTNKAVLIQHEGESFWLPLSVIRSEKPLTRGMFRVSVEVLEDFAMKNAII